MIIRKLLLTAFAILFVEWGSAFAQEGPISTDEIENPGIEYNEAQKEFGIRGFLMSGMEKPRNISTNGGNVAIIEQVGNHNRANSTQTGENIYGVILQNGSGNEALLEQFGSNLQSVINMQGSYNYLDFDQGSLGQDVHNRNAYFKLTGNNLKYDATQTNSNLTLKPKGSSMPALKIETTRQTLPIIISN